MANCVGSCSVGANSTLTVNGRTYRGSRITVFEDGRVMVDGKEVNEDEPETKDGKKVIYRECNITITGNVEGEVRTASGDVTIQGDVRGSVHTMSGDVEVEGNVVGTGVHTMSGNITVAGSCDGPMHSMSGKVKSGQKRRRKE